MLKKIDLSGKVVLDIGACIGYYSLLLSSKVGSNGTVFAFEPESNNFNILKNNIKINNLKNIKPYNLAVGNNNCETFLKLNSSPGQHFVSTEVKEGYFEKINLVKIDEFLVGKFSVKDVGFIKIDVEGYEFEVLKGMKGLILKSDSLIIQVEFAPQHFIDHNVVLSEFIEFIDRCNFSAFYWDLNQEKLVKIVDLTWLLGFAVLKKFEQGIEYSRNLVLIKG